MRKLTYIAVLEPVKGGYSVYFPDLPGCIGYGNNLDLAQSDARESLELHVYGMERDGEPLPSPSSPSELNGLEGNVICAVTIFPDLVRDEMDNRRVKTNVTIPAWLKEAAETRKVNYSRLLESALLEYLDIRPVRKKR